MKVLISGAGGLVGATLTPLLTGSGHGISRLPHSQPWPELAGHDAVVHLAGENIASGRWTPEKEASTGNISARTWQSRSKKGNNDSLWILQEPGAYLPERRNHGR